jgi:hypothetical protein
MLKHIILLICLLQILKAYDLYSILKHLGNVPINQIFYNEDNLNYISIDYAYDFTVQAEDRILDFQINFSIKTSEWDFRSLRVSAYVINYLLRPFSTKNPSSTAVMISILN